MSTKPPETIEQLLRKYSLMTINDSRAKRDEEMLQVSLNTPVGRISKRLIEYAKNVVEYSELAEHIDGKMWSKSAIINTLWHLLEVVYYG